MVSQFLDMLWPIWAFWKLMDQHLSHMPMTTDLNVPRPQPQNWWETVLWAVSAEHSMLARLWFIQMAPPFDHVMEGFVGSHCNVFVPRPKRRWWIFRMDTVSKPSGLLRTPGNATSNWESQYIHTSSWTFVDLNSFKIVFNVEKRWKACVFTVWLCLPAVDINYKYINQTRPTAPLWKALKVIKHHQAHSQTAEPTGKWKS